MPLRLQEVRMPNWIVVITCMTEESRILALDEPTNALDVENINALAASLVKFVAPIHLLNANLINWQYISQAHAPSARLPSHGCVHLPSQRQFSSGRASHLSSGLPF